MFYSACVALAAAVWCEMYIKKILLFLAVAVIYIPFKKRLSHLF